MTMSFCLNFTFGLPKFLFISLTETVTDTVHYAFVTLPILVLYAKITPEKIESSMFAMLMGFNNLWNYFVSPNLGNIINATLVHCTYDTLEENTWKLYLY